VSKLIEVLKTTTLDPTILIDKGAGEGQPIPKEKVKILYRYHEVNPPSIPLSFLSL
jgi:hypothetical protein